MKKLIIRGIALTVLLACLIWEACKKSNSPGTDTPPTPSPDLIVPRTIFTVDGGGFQNQTFTIHGVGYDNCTLYTGPWTSIVNIHDTISSQTTKNLFYMNFDGMSTGAQNIGDLPPGHSTTDIYFNLSLRDKFGNPHVLVFKDPTTTPGTITVTRYGNVGDTVEAKFSGILEDGNGQLVHITNGSFAVVRTADVN